MFLLYFLLWTFILYWIHRIGHLVPVIRRVHWHHHRFANSNDILWHWSNIFLFNDTWISTLDLWITEIIPTILFCFVTGQWWLCAFYYIWAAFIQERLEHNPGIDIKFFTFGKWHRLHHRVHNKNYGLFFPHWDLLFNTYRQVE